MARNRSSRRRRSTGRSFGSHRTRQPSIEWRSVLVIAPLVYGLGVLAGDLAVVVLFGVPSTVFVSAIGVLAACALASIGISWFTGRLANRRPRSIGSIAPPRASIRAGAAVLIPAFLFGFGLAAVG